MGNGINHKRHEDHSKEREERSFPGQTEAKKKNLSIFQEQKKFKIT
jgi:hypothetical protein